MARINPSSLFVDVRGKLQGLLFSSNKAGHYVTAYRKPIQPNTAIQRDFRYAATDAARWWAENAYSIPPDPPWDTQSYKAHWDDFAALPENQRSDWWGEPYEVSGYNEFIAWNVIEHKAGNPLRQLPPQDPIPDVWPHFAFRLRHSAHSAGSYFFSEVTSTAQNSTPWLTLNLRYKDLTERVHGPYYFIANFDYPNANHIIYLQDELESVFGLIPANVSADLRVRFRHTNGKFSAPVHLLCHHDVVTYGP